MWLLGGIVKVYILDYVLGVVMTINYTEITNLEQLFKELDEKWFEPEYKWFDNEAEAADAFEEFQKELEELL